VLAEMRFLIFLNLPFRDAALFAGLEEPFVAQPACSPASLRVPDREGYIAVRRYPGKLPLDIEFFNSMNDPALRRPEFDFFDENKKIGLFAVVFIFDLFARHFIL
jgi:hypothetical protein